MRAIAVASLDEPETDALEWKGALNLTNRKSRFDLSRHLLGFGNRTVQQAQHAFDGYAYRLAGVEPGNLCGVAIPDPADLENALSSFIAHGHLAWRLHRVDVDAVTVAVIEVQPPRDGDRICCLQHRYDASQAGRIYVRLQGQTSEATPDVVRALEDGHAAAAVEAASRAATLHEHGNDLVTQQLALQLERDTRDRRDRAERDAPADRGARRERLPLVDRRERDSPPRLRPDRGPRRRHRCLGGRGPRAGRQDAGTAPAPPAVGAWTAGGCGRRSSRGGRGPCELAMGAWAPRRRRSPRNGRGIWNSMAHLDNAWHRVRVTRGVG